MGPARAAVTILPIAIAIIFAIAIACGSAVPEDAGHRLLRGRPDPDPDIQSACELTGQRCTKCHDIDRVLNAKVSKPEHWERYIERMRRMNGSGIARSESPRILRCLVFWSFGRPGLQYLDDERSTE
jgi:hypothetical protein